MTLLPRLNLIQSYSGTVNINSKLNAKSSLSQLKQPSGILSNDNAEKAELFNKYFASVFEIEGPGRLPEFHDREFTEASN